ncbi:MAG: class I SAM-dependent methyltransferase [Pirellulales bacterium]|nr:class I SAM-dependent methyltransferase [Pirellulales bacterium]
MQTEQFQLHADIELRHWWFVGRRRIMRRLVDTLLGGDPQSPAGQAAVVDIGCGTGANIAALADGYRCVGIDTSAEAVELARQRFPQVEFLVGRAPGDLGSLMGQARLFVMMDVLEHVADDFAMLSELLSAAAPGSHFLLTVPADESLWSEHDESFGHYRRYDLQRFERVWADLPVTTRLLSYFNARLVPLIRMIRARNQRRGHAAGKAGTDFWVPIAPVNRLLGAVFAGEARRLAGMLRGRRCRGYAAGASLVAVLRREEGPIPVRQRPDDLPPDHRND